MKKFILWSVILTLALIISCSCASTVGDIEIQSKETTKTFIPNVHKAYACLSSVKLILEDHGFSEEELPRIIIWVREGIENCPSDLKLSGDSDDYNSIHHCVALSIAGWIALNEEARLEDLISLYCKNSEEATALLIEIQNHTTINGLAVEKYFTECETSENIRGIK